MFNLFIYALFEASDLPFDVDSGLAHRHQAFFGLNNVSLHILLLLHLFLPQLNASLAKRLDSEVCKGDLIIKRASKSALSDKGKVRRRRHNSYMIARIGQ